MLQVEKKYSEQQTTLFCLVLPSQSYKALLYHSKSAVVGRTKSYFIPFVDAEPGSWQESVGAHLALPLRSLVLKEQGTPTHTATGAVSKPCCRGEQAPQNLLNQKGSTTSSGRAGLSNSPAGLYMPWKKQMAGEDASGYYQNEMQ